MEPKYPHLPIALSTSDGNASVILAKCRYAMRRDGIDKDEIERFTKEANSGDYDHLLQTVMAYFDTH